MADANPLDLSVEELEASLAERQDDTRHGRIFSAASVQAKARRILERLDRRLADLAP